MVALRGVSESLILGIFQRRSDRLDDELNLRCEEEESKMWLRLLSQSSGRMDLH